MSVDSLGGLKDGQKTRIILNPSAAAGRAPARLAAVKPIFAKAWENIDWCVSDSQTHLLSLAQAAVNQKFTRVIIVGGDGSVSCALSAFIGADTALGVLPCGTGNDFATAAGIPANLNSAANALISGHPQQVDLGEVNGTPFCCVVGIGIDTPALKFINASSFRRGKFLYQFAAIRTLLQYKAAVLSVSIGSTLVSEKMLFASFANTPTYAGGHRISPLAEIADGKIDFCLFSDASVLQRLTTFACLRSGKHIGRSGVVFGTATEIQIECARAQPITIDGELTEIMTPATIRVLPNALRLICAS
jgi:diacylglycerol kinase (ATP)